MKGGRTVEEQTIHVKESYVEPEIEVVYFESEDIITESGDVPGPPIDP